MNKVFETKSLYRFALLLLMTACGGSSGQEAKLVGRWAINLGLAASTMTFSDDFAFTIEAASLFGKTKAPGRRIRIYCGAPGARGT